jgi:hypothetical protein
MAPVVFMDFLFKGSGFQNQPDPILRRETVKYQALRYVVSQKLEIRNNPVRVYVLRATKVDSLIALWHE